jgi:hypothetical protein
MMGCKKGESCRNLLRELQILHLVSQYILSLAILVINIKHQYTINSEIYNKHTKQLNNIHEPRPNLSKYLKGISYLAIKGYKYLPSCIKGKIDDSKKLQKSVQESFYSYTVFIL